MAISFEGATVTAEVAKQRTENLTALLKAMGSVVASESQKAFDEQAWDGIPWERQYPNQDDPFVHIAGLISDLNMGRDPLRKRFSRGQALRDTGRLANSIASRVLNRNTAEVGSDLPYADLQQRGGDSVMPIKDEARDRLIQVLRKLSKGSQGDEYRQKLGWLLAVEKGSRRRDREWKFKTLETKVGGRQFVGVTRDLEKDLARVVELFIETGRG